METRNDTDGKDKTGRTETVGTFSFIYLGVPQRFAFQLSLFVTWKSLADSIISYSAIGPRCATSAPFVTFSSAPPSLSASFSLSVSAVSVISFIGCCKCP